MALIYCRSACSGDSPQLQALRTGGAPWRTSTVYMTCPSRSVVTFLVSYMSERPEQDMPPAPGPLSNDAEHIPSERTGDTQPVAPAEQPECSSRPLRCYSMSAADAVLIPAPCTPSSPANSLAQGSDSGGQPESAEAQQSPPPPHTDERKQIPKVCSTRHTGSWHYNHIYGYPRTVVGDG